MAVELRQFHLHWSGNRAVAAFDQGMDERAQTLSLSWQPMALSAAVPEPQALWLLAGGLGQLGWRMRRRR